MAGTNQGPYYDSESGDESESSDQGNVESLTMGLQNVNIRIE